jgi:hypothetical protein
VYVLWAHARDRKRRLTVIEIKNYVSICDLAIAHVGYKTSKEPGTRTMWGNRIQQ